MFCQRSESDGADNVGSWRIFLTSIVYTVWFALATHLALGYAKNASITFIVFSYSWLLALVMCFKRQQFLGMRTAAVLLIGGLCMFPFSIYVNIRWAQIVSTIVTILIIVSLSVFSSCTRCSIFSR